MKQVIINLYSFRDLSKDVQQLVIAEHKGFLESMPVSIEDENGNMVDEFEEYTDEDTIDAIEANGYLYFKDGTLTSCTTYTGGHEKTGTTEFRLHGDTYDITGDTEFIPRSTAFAIAAKFYGSDYPMQHSQFDNAAKELGY